MAIITSSPFVLKDVDLKFGADNYEAHVNTVRFDPATSQVTWQGLTPNATFSASTNPVWTLTVAGVQDWGTVDSLTDYLLENAGQEVEVVFMPQKGSGQRTFTATVTITPPPIGGDVNTVAQFSVTMGVSGQPVPGTSAP